MNPVEIQYRIRLQDGSEKVIDLALDPQTLDILTPPPSTLPAWTQLEFYQCPHCPLDVGSHPHCPAAVRMVEIVEQFNQVNSYDGVEVEVVTSDRTTIRATTSQKALSSLFGVLMATSGCPHTAFLKPMARFHLPLSTQEETIYRVTGMYLLAQYFLQREGKTPDTNMKGLHLLYANLRKVNVEIAARIRHSSELDSSVNAVAVLDVFANILPFALEDELARIESLFAHYLTDFYETEVLDKLKD
ncbi:MAG: DUF6901 family protein [Pseudomonadota bacterium]